MIKFIYVLIFVPIISFAQEQINQTDNNGLRQGLWKRNYPNGRLLYEGHFKNDKPVGEWRRYHENGVVRAILQHVENNDSVSAELFDLSGKLVAKGFYKIENKVGKWDYFDNGRKVMEEEYSDGVKVGTSRVYYPSGELLEETEWNNNQRNGRYKAYYQSGKTFLECMYLNDKRSGFCVTYYPSGAMEIDAYYQDDLPHGEWKYYNEKEELRLTLHYDNGLLLNPEALYDLETRQLEEMERKGKSISDPEKFMHNPMDYLLKNQ